MTSIAYTSWQKDVSGTWATASDWTNGAPDTSFTAATLGSFATAYVVTSSANETVYSLEVDASATLDISSGVFRNYNSIAPYSLTYLDGTIDVGVGARMVFGLLGSPSNDSARISGTGIVEVQGGILEVAAPYMGIFGVTLALSNKGEITATSNSTLENRNGLISGAGSLGGGATFQLTNDLGGTIDATGAAGSALTIDTGSDQIENAGLLESIGVGGLVIDGNLNNDGILLASVGTITLDDCAAYGGGTVIVDAGATLRLHDSLLGTTGPLEIGSATTVGGLVSTTKGDMIVTGTNGTPAGDVLSTDAFNYGAIEIVDDSVLNFDAFVDEMTSSASLNLMASGAGVAELVVFDGGAEIDGGVLAMSNAAGNGIVSNGASEQFSNGALLTGSGVIGDGYLRFYNASDGVVDADGSVGLTVVDVSKGTESANYSVGLVEATGAGKLMIEGAFGNGGLIDAASARGITLDDAQITTGGGEIMVAAGGALILENGSQIAQQSKIMIAAGGVLSTIAGAAIACNMFDSGTVNVGGGSTLILEYEFVSTATGRINVGAAASAATVEVAAGGSWDLFGDGAINLANAGDKIVGAGPGAEFWDDGGVIVGAGQIGDGAMGIHLSNFAVVDATGALTFDNDAGDSGNDGILEATRSGKLTIDNALYDPGEILADGGTIVAQSGISGPGSAEIEGGGTLELGGADGNDLIFGTGGGMLQIDSAGSQTSDVFGLAKGDTIDLRGLGFVAGHMALGASSNFGAFEGLLTVTNGAANSQSFYLEGNYTAAYLGAHHLQWSFTSDNHGGTNVGLA